MVQSIFFALLSFISIYVGGQLALRNKNWIKPLIAFCGGTLVAVSLLDMIPEASELLSELDLLSILSITLGSFMFFHFIDKVISIHGHSHSEECEDHDHKKTFGVFAATGVITHSFIDGIVIGTAFLINISTGLLIASIVLLHNFADGINTVTLLLRNKHEKRIANFFLLIASVVPLLGVLTAHIIKPTNSILGYILAFFAGFFLYMGATDLLPEAHRERSSVKYVLFTLLGVALVVLFRVFLGHEH